MEPACRHPYTAEGGLSTFYYYYWNSFSNLHNSASVPFPLPLPLLPPSLPLSRALSFSHPPSFRVIVCVCVFQSYSKSAFSDVMVFTTSTFKCVRARAYVYLFLYLCVYKCASVFLVEIYIFGTNIKDVRTVACWISRGCPRESERPHHSLLLEPPHWRDAS